MNTAAKASSPPTYAQLLKDPRWQRKRLEILSRSDFTCEVCGSADRSLHVHHKTYRRGAKPWEYENDQLQALCENCHHTRHALQAQITEILPELPSSDLERLAAYAAALRMMHADGFQEFEYDVSTLNQICGITDALSALARETDLIEDKVLRTVRSGALTSDGLSRLFVEVRSSSVGDED